MNSHSQFPLPKPATTHPLPSPFCLHGLPNLDTLHTVTSVSAFYPAARFQAHVHLLSSRSCMTSPVWTRLLLSIHPLALVEARLPHSCHCPTAWCGVPITPKPLGWTQHFQRLSWSTRTKAAQLPFPEHGHRLRGLTSHLSGLKCRAVLLTDTPCAGTWWPDCGSCPCRPRTCQKLTPWRPDCPLLLRGLQSSLCPQDKGHACSTDWLSGPHSPHL